MNGLTIYASYIGPYPISRSMRIVEFRGPCRVHFVGGVIWEAEWYHSDLRILDATLSEVLLSRFQSSPSHG